MEWEETVSIHNHAKGVPDATMTSVAFQLASGPKELLEKKSAGTSLFFSFFFFSGSFGPYASWNATDVIVASGTPFAWLWMLTVSSNSTICLHGSQLGFVTRGRPLFLPRQSIPLPQPHPTSRPRARRRRQPGAHPRAPGQTASPPLPLSAAPSKRPSPPPKTTHPAPHGATAIPHQGRQMARPQAHPRP